MRNIFILLCFSFCRSKSIDIVDLTHLVSEETAIAWPNAQGFDFNVIVRGDFWPEQEQEPLYYVEANNFSQSEHCGTHLDAPAHFSLNRWRVDQIPFDRLFGEAVVIDISSRAALNNDERLIVDDLIAWEAIHGRIPNGAVVIMYSGHGKYYYNRTRYFGYPPGVYEANPQDVENLHFPGFHEEAAQWLVQQRNIIGIGVDGPSTDYGPSLNFKVHQIIGEANIWGLENLANVDRLPPKGYTIYAMVHKIKGGSGGPARVFAKHSSSGAVEPSITFSGICVLLLLAQRRAF